MSDVKTTYKIQTTPDNPIFATDNTDCYIKLSQSVSNAGNGSLVKIVFIDDNPPFIGYYGEKVLGFRFVEDEKIMWICLKSEFDEKTILVEAD